MTTINFNVMGSNCKLEIAETSANYNVKMVARNAGIVGVRMPKNKFENRSLVEMLLKAIDKMVEKDSILGANIYAAGIKKALKTGNYSL